ncbi:MAG: S8 family serine peptidase [Chloroflexota bacterium]
MVRSPWLVSSRVLLVLILVLATLLSAVAPAGAAPTSQTVDRAYAPDSVLVRFASDTPAAERANARVAVQAQLVHEYNLVPGLEQLRLPVDKIGVERALEILSHRPGVLYAQPDFEVRLAADPKPANDPYYQSGQMWGLNDVNAPDADVNAPEAWATTTGNPATIVAVIDTGVQYTHPDLAANIWTNAGEISGNGVDDDNNGYTDDVYGWDWGNNDNNPMDANGHGTHVAGTIGAVGNNSIGVVGVNWNVKIMPLKFFADNGTGYVSSAAKALEYAVAKGVKISNNSWVGGWDQAMNDALTAAAAQGHLFVAAAGNASNNNDRKPTYPGSLSHGNILSVAAINSSQGLASFSNYGAQSVDLAAPGVDILSTYPTGTYAWLSGTSMASPHVAGAAALVWGANPSLTLSQLRARLLDNVRPLPSLAGKVASGGTLDVAKALGTSAPQPQPPAAPSALTAIAVSGSQIDLAWTDNAGDETGYEIERALDGVGFSPLGTVGANVKSYSDTGLTAGTTYSYRVRAYNGAGNSAYSNMASAITPPATSALHVGGLVGVGAPQPKGKWMATVTVTVVDQAGQPVPGVTVSGKWSNGAAGSVSVITNSSGVGTVSKSGLNTRTGSVTFTVTNLVKSGATYNVADNTLSSVVIYRP